LQLLQVKTGFAAGAGGSVVNSAVWAGCIMVNFKTAWGLPVLAFLQCSVLGQHLAFEKPLAKRAAFVGQ
jgi:hypothetical protein